MRSATGILNATRPLAIGAFAAAALAGCGPAASSSSGGGPGGGGPGGGSPPQQPTNVSPPDGADGIVNPFTLKASAYSEPDGDAHRSSVWNVSKDPAFGSLTFGSGEDFTNLTQIALPPIPPPGPFYWRVRYKDEKGKFSAYSTPTVFMMDVACAIAKVAYSHAIASGSSEIIVMTGDGLVSKSMTQAAECTCKRHDVLWSPDGQHVAYPVKGALAVTRVESDLTSTNPFVDVLFVPKNEGEYAWSSSSAFLAYGSREDAASPSGIFTAVLGAPPPLAPVTTAPPGTFDHCPAIRPDGLQIAFVRHLANGTNYEIRSVDSAGGAETLLWSGKSASGEADENLYLQWFPDNVRLLFKVKDAGASNPAGVFVLDLSNPFVPTITNPVTFKVRLVRLSPDASKIAFITTQGDVYVADTATFTSTKIASPADFPSGLETITWSPDSLCLAALSGGNVAYVELLSKSVLPIATLSPSGGGTDGGVGWSSQ